jgi:hypothetical protein
MYCIMKIDARWTELLRPDWLLSRLCDGIWGGRAVGNEIGCRRGEPVALIQILEFGAPANALPDGTFLGRRARSL